MNLIEALKSGKKIKRTEIPFWVVPVESTTFSVEDVLGEWEVEPGPPELLDFLSALTRLVDGRAKKIYRKGWGIRVGLDEMKCLVVLGENSIRQYGTDFLAKDWIAE